MRVAAIGDSFTEGIGDTLPDKTVRGWADVVAAGLASASQEPVWYANLAVRGRLLAPIATEQLDAALALDPAPDVLTFNGGGNDMLRAGWDADVIAAHVDRVARLTADAGVRLVVLSGPDPTERLPRGRVFAERAADLMVIVDELTAAYPHVMYVDNYRDVEMRRAAYWSPDRLHMSPLGHARVAARVLKALGVDAELPRAASEDPPAPGRWENFAFAGRYLVPWFARRVSGRSSGDRRSAKYPEWTRVEAPTQAAGQR